MPFLFCHFSLSWGKAYKRPYQSLGGVCSYQTVVVVANSVISFRQYHRLCDENFGVRELETGVVICMPLAKSFSLFVYKWRYEHLSQRVLVRSRQVYGRIPGTKWVCNKCQFIIFLLLLLLLLLLLKEQWPPGSLDVPYLPLHPTYSFWEYRKDAASGIVDLIFE